VTVDDLTDVDATQAVDDHNAPQMFITSTGQIQLRYAIHDVAESFFQKISTNIEDITAWGDRSNISDSGTAEVHNYPQVKQITSGNMLMFYRRGPFNNAKQYYKVSSNIGATWGEPNLLIDHGTGYGVYAFVVNNGNQIHIAWNYQDASVNKRFDIYYMYSDDGGANWKKRDGTAITLPASPSNADLVFDSGIYQAYCWDIRLDESNNPYIVFAYKEDPFHEFRYAKYNAGWVTYQITTSRNLYEPADHFYSGGVVIDPNDVSIVYLSKQYEYLEIEKWISIDYGETWNRDEQITRSSNEDNFRLQVIENYKTDMRLVWCKGVYTGIDAGEWNGFENVSIVTELP